MTSNERTDLLEKITSTHAPTTSDPNAPYVPGDPIAAYDNTSGTWREGMVTVIVQLRDERVRFGLRWLMRIDFHDSCIGAMCDDNGRNTTRHYEVRPSEVVE